MAGLGPLAAWLVHRPASAHGEKHESGAAAPPVVKEQKPWGIAAGTKEAKRFACARSTAAKCCTRS